MDLTPKQWAYYVKGRQDREKREMQKLAWVVANIVNASGNLKRPVTVDMLLGKSDKQQVEPSKLDFKELGKWVL